jgi:N-acetyltransferase
MAFACGGVEAVRFVFTGCVGRFVMKIEPVTLTGHIVRLEPLQMRHAAELYAVSSDPAIWAYFIVLPPASVADMEQIIAVAVQEREAGECLPFAIVDKAQDRIVGSTRLYNFMWQDRGLEIGWTWLTPSAQRTGINTECKYLLLRHAFETLGAIRVQLRAHHLNMKSQRAIERLGAVKEGTLRNHAIMPDGTYRHRVYFSIIESEWPQVKAGLEAKMQRTY